MRSGSVSRRSSTASSTRWPVGVAPLGPDAAALLEEARRSVSGGKRFRAAFCWWGYRAFQPDVEDEEALLRACAALELLHASALVHDDYMDASDTRRGRPATHRSFASAHRGAGWRGDPEQYGAAAAILLGDVLGDPGRRAGRASPNPCRARAAILDPRRTGGQPSATHAQCEPAGAAPPDHRDRGQTDAPRCRRERTASGQIEVRGRRRPGYSILPVRGRLRVPAITEVGYHRLLIDDRDIVLAVAPGRCHTIEDAVPDARLWGLAAQVYALRQSGDGGIGDAAGIAALAESAGRREPMRWRSVRCSTVHREPARSRHTRRPGRLFLNPLHAAPGLVFGAEHVAQEMRQPGSARRSPGWNCCTLIDWPEAGRRQAWRCCARCSKALWPSRKQRRARGRLRTFRADGGELLAQHVDIRGAARRAIGRRS